MCLEKKQQEKIVAFAFCFVAGKRSKNKPIKTSELEDLAPLLPYT